MKGGKYRDIKGESRHVAPFRAEVVGSFLRPDSIKEAVNYISLDFYLMMSYAILRMMRLKN